MLLHPGGNSGRERASRHVHPCLAVRLSSRGLGSRALLAGRPGCLRVVYCQVGAPWSHNAVVNCSYDIVLDRRKEEKDRFGARTYRHQGVVGGKI